LSTAVYRSVVAIDEPEQRLHGAQVAGAAVGAAGWPSSDARHDFFTHGVKILALSNLLLAVIRREVLLLTTNQR
jgi:hypothetical protein